MRFRQLTLTFLRAYTIVVYNFFMTKYITIIGKQSRFHAEFECETNENNNRQQQPHNYAAALRSHWNEMIILLLSRIRSCPTRRHRQ